MSTSSRPAFLGHQVGVWCGACLRSSAITYHVAATTADALEVRSVTKCRDCQQVTGRDEDVAPRPVPARKDVTVDGVPLSVAVEVVERLTGLPCPDCGEDGAWKVVGAVSASTGPIALSLVPVLVSASGCSLCAEPR